MDRRFRPIYEALDARNHKRALKHCNALLQKNKDSQLGKALKALVLERMARFEEAFQLCIEVKDSQPPVTDETTLSTLSLVFRNLGKVEEATICYDNASKAHPQNEELALGAFYSYAREGNFVKQQQTAMRMLKQFSKDKYYFWAVVSITLQYHQKGEASLLLLADRMLSKLVNEGKITKLEELLFYLGFLEDKGEYAKALQEINGKLGEVFSFPIDRLAKKAFYHYKLSQFTEALESYTELLAKNNEEWAYYVGYLDSLFATTELSQVITVGKEVITKYKQQSDGFQARRGPYLAEIELYNRFLKKTDQPDFQPFYSLIVDYFETFGSKAACFLDLRPYLHQIPSSSTEDIIKQLEQISNKLLDSDVNKVYQRITLQKIKYSLGELSQNDSDQKIALANALIEAYLHSLTLPVKLEETEDKPGDEFLVLAAVALMNEYNQQTNRSNIQPLVEGLILVEFGLQRSKYNFSLKLILILLYELCGSFQPCVTLFTSLDIKHIQFDTLSYLVLDAAIRFGFKAEALHICNDIFRFQFDARKEMPDLATHPYRHGSYTKAKEFIDFKDRLERSHQLAIAHTEAALIDLSNKLHDENQLIEYLNLNASKLVFTDEALNNFSKNQDYELLNAWEWLPPFENFAATSATFSLHYDLQLKYLKLYRVVLNLLLLALERKSQEFVGLLSIFSDTLAKLSLVQPSENVEGRLSFDVLCWTFSQVGFEAFHDFNILLEGKEEHITSFKEKFSKLQQLLTVIEEHVKRECATSVENDLLRRGAITLQIPKLRLFIQVSSWFILLALKCDSQIPSRRKKKKGSEGNWGIEVKNLLKSFATQYLLLLRWLQELFSKESTEVAIPSFESRIPSLKQEDFTSVTSQVLETVMQSYTTSFSRLLTDVKLLETLFKKL